AVLALQAERQTPARPGPYREYRANLHVHSGLSHDSRGTLDEIVAAARAVGTTVLLFTEHPSERFDYFTDGHRGTRDGVLLIRRYPQESFSAVQDYPADYLRRWDQLCARAPHTGVAANDAHQNVGLVVRLADGGRLCFEDVLGKKLFELGAGLVPALEPRRK